jgi:molybdopterin-containing oxidoreductase family membrane subunit
VTSLHRDYLPSSWAMFYPTWVYVGIFVGSIGVFITLFLLFVRVLPPVAIAEVKMILKAQSLAGKKALIKEGNQDPSHIEYFKETLEMYDSVSQREIDEIEVK